MRLCCASLSVFDLPGGRLGGLVPPQVVGDRCMVTENSGLGVGLLVIYYYVYTCFLSNKMPQKLWAAGVLPRTLLRKFKAFSQTSDIAALLLKNFTLCSRPCGPRALGPKHPPPTVFFLTNRTLFVTLCTSSNCYMNVHVDESGSEAGLSHRIKFSVAQDP